jgi:phospholipase/carboxylesterase
MMTGRDIFGRGRLVVKPVNFEKEGDASTGLQKLDFDGKRDGLLYIPAAYRKEVPCPLAVMLHGAGGDANHGMGLLKHFADTNNIILLAPASRSASWDIISNDRFGPDVIFINQALTQVFKHYAIDAARLAICGFSD